MFENVMLKEKYNLIHNYYYYILDEKAHLLIVIYSDADEDMFGVFTKTFREQVAIEMRRLNNSHFTMHISSLHY